MTQLPLDTCPAIQQAADMLREARRGVALTGAGISTPSGIPDFRSAGSGLWARFLPMEVASLSAFRYQPERFFQWLHPLASHMLSAQPNPAHLALARLEEAGSLTTLITQNIDGLHTRAGFKNVLEVHGSLNTLTCVRCYNTFSSTGLIDDFLENATIPYCPQCQGILKPDVILFEEQLPVRTWMKAEEACKECDLMFVAGTSLEVMPSAALPVKAIENGARLILINRTSTYIDVRADLVIRGNVADILPIITNTLLGE